jgi:hypothetical protein
VQNASSRLFWQVVSGYVIHGMKREIQEFENRTLNEGFMMSCLGCVAALKVRSEMREAMIGEHLWPIKMLIHDKGSS